MNIAEMPWTIEIERGFARVKYAVVGPISTSDVRSAASPGPRVVRPRDEREHRHVQREEDQRDAIDAGAGTPARTG